MIHDVSQATNPATRLIAADEHRTLDLAKRQPPAARSDSVELSDAARRHAEAAPVREGLVSRVRAEIARDTYLTEEKLDAAIDALLRDALD
jgi:hypothetical protein